MPAKKFMSGKKLLGPEVRLGPSIGEVRIGQSYRRGIGNLIIRNNRLTREPWEMSNSKKLNSCRISKYT